MREYTIARRARDAQVAPIDDYVWGGAYRPRAQARLYRDGQALCLAMEAWEKPENMRMEEDARVHLDSCLEAFLQPLPTADPRYINFEVNPRGVLHAKIGAGRGDRRPLDIAAVQVTPFVENGEETHWGFVLRLPLDFLRSIFGAPHENSMRGNFYKCGDATPQPHYGVWSGGDAATRGESWPKPDFHRPEFFGAWQYA